MEHFDTAIWKKYSNFSNSASWGRPTRGPCGGDTHGGTPSGADPPHPLPRHLTEETPMQGTLQEESLPLHPSSRPFAGGSPHQGPPAGG